MIRVLLLWAVIDNNPCIRDSSVLGNQSYVRTFQEFDGFDSVGQLVYFLQHGRRPDVAEEWIRYELAVFRNGFLGDWMYNSIADVVDGIVDFQYLIVDDCIEGVPVEEGR